MVFQVAVFIGVVGYRSSGLQCGGLSFDSSLLEADSSSLDSNIYYVVCVEISDETFHIFFNGDLGRYYYQSGWRLRN